MALDLPRPVALWLQKHLDLIALIESEPLAHALKADLSRVAHLPMDARVKFVMAQRRKAWRMKWRRRFGDAPYHPSFSTGLLLLLARTRVEPTTVRLVCRRINDLQVLWFFLWLFNFAWMICGSVFLARAARASVDTTTCADAVGSAYAATVVGVCVQWALFASYAVVGCAWAFVDPVPYREPDGVADRVAELEAASEEGAHQAIEVEVEWGRGELRVANGGLSDVEWEAVAIEVMEAVAGDGFGDDGLLAEELLENFVVATTPAKDDVRPREDRGDDRHICPICLDDFKPGNVLRRLPCEHRFHEECLHKWVRGGWDGGIAGKATCPMCK
ncbi:hypothetical protein HK101_004634, partial [Irineochytrium annulatum]